MVNKEKYWDEKMRKIKKLNEIFGKEFIRGLKMGLELSKKIAEKQGFEIYFPDVDKILIERGKENENGK